MRTKTRILTSIMALALGASACSGSGSESGTTDLDPDDIILTGGLTTVDSCDALLDRFVEIGLERVGPWGFGQGGPVIMEDVVMMEEAVDDGASPTVADSAGGDAKFGNTAEPANSDSSEGGGISGTNNQEADVDEADLVKTDGTRLVTVMGQYAYVFDVTGASPTLTSKIKLPDEIWGGEIFLSGDKAILMTSGWSDLPLYRELEVVGYQGTDTARLIELDLATGTVGNMAEFDGRYISARQVGNTIRIALTSQPSAFPFVYPSNQGAEESAKTANQDLVRKSSIDAWLPSYRVTSAGETLADGHSIDCSRVYLPAEYSGMGTVSVITLDVNEGITPDSIGTGSSVGIVSSGETVYSSTDRMTIATARWPEFDSNGEAIREEEAFTTVLHNFDISEPGQTEYVASGAIPGSLLSQYSLSENGGYLRVATTEGAQWWVNEDSESSVYVLAEEGNELKVVGSTTGLGKGERIFSVRFMGERAYVVTFRQTDPLYVVDLSDPTNPTTVGELKIPGFSSYLHPVGDDMLIGVGQDGNDDGTTTGSAVSLFDISDPSNPTRVDLLNLGENSYSQVDWDAKAFTYWDDNRTAYVPISWWSYDEANGSEDNGSASVAVQINDGTLTEVARLAQPVTKQCDSGIYKEYPTPVEPVGEGDTVSSDDAEASLVDPVPAPGPDPEEYCWTYQPEIRRTVIFEDKVFTISEAGLMVSALDGYQTLDWITFQEQ